MKRTCRGRAPPGPAEAQQQSGASGRGGCGGGGAHLRYSLTLWHSALWRESQHTNPSSATTADRDVPGTARIALASSPMILVTSSYFLTSSFCILRNEIKSLNNCTFPRLICKYVFRSNWSAFRFIYKKQTCIFAAINLYSIRIISYFRLYKLYICAPVGLDVVLILVYITGTRSVAIY